MEESGTRKLAAIMFTDIRGFSRKMGENETVAMALLRAHDAMMHELVAKHGGTVIKSIGDSFMVDFASAVNAVKCAMEAQQIFWYYNKGKSDLEKIEIRVGIHLGDVITDGKDIFGDGVNIASRIEAITQPNRICISQDIYNQVKNKMPLQAHSLGPVEFKNIAEPIEVFEILIESIPELAKPSQATVPQKIQKKLEAETKREAEEAKRVEEVKQKIDEDALKLEQKQQKAVQEYYASAERLFNEGRLDDAERQIGEIFKIVALHAGAQLLQMKIEEHRFRKSEEERIRRSEEERRAAQERDERIQKLLDEARRALERNATEEGLSAARAVLEMSPEHEQALALEKEFLEAAALQAELAREEAEVAQAEEAAPVEAPRPKAVLKTVAPTQEQVKRRKQMQSLLAILIVAALAVVGLVIALPNLQSILFPLSTSVAVVPLQTSGDQPENAYLGEAFSVMMTEEFARVGQLRTIASVSTAAARRGGLSAEALAEEFRVGFVMRGEVLEQDNGFQIRLWLQNVDKGLTVLSRTYTLTPGALAQLRSVVVKDALQAMELEREVPSPAPLTSSDDALRGYLKGMAGLYALDSSRIRSALENFRSAFQTDSMMADAAAGAAAAALRLYGISGESDRSLLREAQEFSQAALRIRQDLPLAYQTLGSVLRYRQRVEDSRQSLLHALELQPGDAEARRQLALLDLMEGETSSALRHAERALERDPRNPASLSVIGIVHHFSGRHEAALEAYEAAIGLGASDSLLTIRYRMTTWLATGRGESAVRYARNLLDRSPGDYRASYWLGQAVQLSGRALESQKLLDSADVHSQTALLRNPLDPDVRLYRALILSRKGDFTDAMTELGRAEVLAPDSPRLLYRKANVLWIQNKKPEAIQALASAVNREFLLPEILGADFVYLATDPEFTSAVTLRPQGR